MPVASLARTHDVFNQSTPWADVNLFTTNAPLQSALRLHAPRLPLEGLTALGAEMGSADMQTHARLANTHKPQLRTHDRFGHRTDVVEFHPSYHALMGAALRHGLHATPWTRQDTAHAHLERAAGFMLFTEAEPSVLCPVSMSYAVTPALRGNAAVWADWSQGLTGTQYDPRLALYSQKSALTMGMGMTEKQGGSDLRACVSRAEPLAQQVHGQALYLINGHKWFFSAPMSDAHLVLAHTDEGPSCFFLPRWRWDGAALNDIHIQRLKDKLGNRSNSSSEVEFHDSEGLLVGQPGRGIAVLVEMAGFTRLQCVVGSTALMRAALVQALHWARGLSAFGRRLTEQPLMQQVLADLALETEAALALMLRLAEAFERSDSDPVERAWQRVLTPAAKLWVCKRALAVTGEAMEVLGGNGYVETGSLARLYREAPVNSIWEGSGNVMALDVLRAAQREPEALQAWLDAQAPKLEAPEQHRVSRLRSSLFSTDAEPQARHLASELVLLAQAALLNETGPATIAADFTTSRLRQPAALFGASPLAHAATHLARALPA
jgi:putative acyl-CoA dehydrogenase